MKTFYTLALFLVCSLTMNAQSERSLDETKQYIVKMINDYGYKHGSATNRAHAEFNGDSLKVKTSVTLLGKIESESVYNFANVYRYKGPDRKPGDVGCIVIWVDCLAGFGKEKKWVKDTLEMDIHSYEGAEQLLIAFRHLSELLQQKKPVIEKF